MALKKKPGKVAKKAETVKPVEEEKPVKAKINLDKDPHHPSAHADGASCIRCDKGIKA